MGSRTAIATENDQMIRKLLSVTLCSAVLALPSVAKGTTVIWDQSAQPTQVAADHLKVRPAVRPAPSTIWTTGS
jgi:hypothetical protein